MSASACSISRSGAATASCGAPRYGRKSGGRLKPGSLMRDDNTGWLQLTLDRALAEGFKGVKVDVSGHLGATFYTERQSLRTPAMFRHN